MPLFDERRIALRKVPLALTWTAVYSVALVVGLLVVPRLGGLSRPATDREVFLAAAFRGDAAAIAACGPVDQVTLNDALVRAAHYANPETVEVLLARGADVNSRDAEGYPALVIAGADGSHSLEERQAIWKVLLRHHADISATDQFGRTALHQAALFGDAALVRALVKRGADVNAADRLGSTPLMTAAADPEIVRLLLAAGADPSIKDGQGKTALSYASGHGRAALLAAKGSRRAVR